MYLKKFYSVILSKNKSEDMFNKIIEIGQFFLFVFIMILLCKPPYIIITLICAYNTVTHIIYICVYRWGQGQKIPLSTPLHPSRNFWSVSLSCKISWIRWKMTVTFGILTFVYIWGDLIIIIAGFIDRPSALVKHMPPPPKKRGQKLESSEPNAKMVHSRHEFISYLARTISVFKVRKKWNLIFLV